jgi:hypothetical protein
VARCRLKRIATVAAASVLLATPGAAGAAPAAVVAGGALDPSIASMDVYLAEPIRADAPATRACQAARSYVELADGGRFAEMPELFAENAVVMDPAGRTLQGRSQITDFYEGPIRRMRPRLMAVAYVGDEVDCMVELATLKPVEGRLRWVLVSIDHFTMAADGKVARMVAFARAPRAPPAAGPATPSGR